MKVNSFQKNRLLTEVELLLRDRVQREEAEYSRKSNPSNSLWGHAERVALFAERLGRAEGVDPIACRLAGIFHDAGKFNGGSYHEGDEPEEKRSVEALWEITKGKGLETSLIDQVAESILQLYRDDPEPTHLTKILFDADNLDKLGSLGIANYFIKVGLRGGGLSRSCLYHLTVELTYARYAPGYLTTKTGQGLARKRAPEAISLFKSLLDSLREDGLYDFRIDEVIYDDMVIDVVTPVSCECSGELSRRIWEIPGIKCSEIHLKHFCSSCGKHHELRFCRPRLV